MNEEGIFPFKGNVMEHNHKEDDDPKRDGNLPIDERLEKAAEWKKEDGDRKKRLEEIEEEQKKQIIFPAEKGELSSEEKRAKLEKLKGYLDELIKKEALFINSEKNKIAFEVEIKVEKVKAEIERLEEELGE